MLSCNFFRVNIQSSSINFVQLSITIPLLIIFLFLSIITSPYPGLTSNFTVFFYYYSKVTRRKESLRRSGRLGLFWWIRKRKFSSSFYSEYRYTSFYCVLLYFASGILNFFTISRIVTTLH